MEYEPYGDDWKAYLAKEKKATIVEIASVLGKEREALQARIAELEGENKRLRRVSSIASDGTTTEMQPVDWHKFAAYQKALDDVDRILDWRRDLILDCMCEEFISDKVEALRGGGE